MDTTVDIVIYILYEEKKLEHKLHEGQLKLRMNAMVNGVGHNGGWCGGYWDEVSQAYVINTDHGC